MDGNLNSSAVAPIDRVVPAVSPHVHVLASHQRPHSRVLVPCSQHFPIVRLFILETDYVVSGAALPLAAGKVLILHVLDLLLLALAFLVHELPPFKVPFVFLNPFLLDELAAKLALLVPSLFVELSVILSKAILL